MAENNFVSKDREKTRITPAAKWTGRRKKRGLYWRCRKAAGENPPLDGDKLERGDAWESGHG